MRVLLFGTLTYCSKGPSSRGNYKQGRNKSHCLSHGCKYKAVRLMMRKAYEVTEQTPGWVDITPYSLLLSQLLSSPLLPSPSSGDCIRNHVVRKHEKVTVSSPHSCYNTTAGFLVCVRFKNLAQIGRNNI